MKECCTRARLLAYISAALILLLILALTPAAPGVAGARESTTTSDFDALLNGMQHYFGNLHSHTAYSDGRGTPQQAFQWARDVIGLDFYAVTDHAEMVDSSEWQKTGEQADLMYQPGEFVAMRGFEWSNFLLGHICVFNTADYTNMFKTPLMRKLYEWIHNNGGYGQFNHPGREPFVFSNLKYMNDTLGYPMSAIETGNKTTGNNDQYFYKYFIRALDNGWRVAPTNNQDNHSLSACSHRTAIISPGLSRESVVDALEDRRVYSTDDPNMEVIFKHGKDWMGSEIEREVGTVTFDVAVRDDEEIEKIELITTGGEIAAETSFPDQEDSRLVFWNPEVDVTGCAYYFLRVTERDSNNDDDARSGTQVALSAPIWINILIDSGEAPSGNWYKGDLHAHSKHSDGDTPVAGVLAIALAKGFDYFVLTDHDTVAQWDDPDYHSDDMTLLYGVEWTSSRGHANIWSDRRFDWSQLDWTQQVGDAKSAIEIAHRLATGGQVVLFSPNHPHGIGCGWLYPYEDSREADCMEVWNARYLWPNQNNLTVLKTLDEYLKRGKRISMVGGSDSHLHSSDPWNLFARLQQLYHDLGNPTTWVYSPSRDAVDILSAMKNGRVAISADPGGPLVELLADPSYSDGGPVTYEIMMGDSIPENAIGKRVRFQVRVTDAAGSLPAVLVIRKNGKAFTGTLGHSDDFVFDFVDVPRKGDYYYAQLHQLTLNQASNPITQLVILTQFGWVVGLTNPIYTWTDTP